MSKSDTEEKLDLKEVYNDLTSHSPIRTPRVIKVLSTFAKLLGLKPSFASRTHTEFKKLVQ